MNNLIQAGVVIIGNEILSGRTQEINLQVLARHLSTVSIFIAESRIVLDDEERIQRAVKDLCTVYDYVFTTGGIGPTHDDVTAQALAQAFNRKLKHHPLAYKLLEAHYGKENLTPGRLKMCDIPEGAVLINNPISMAPGFQIENVYVLAGVPKIMEAMLQGILAGLQGGKPVHQYTLQCNLTEGVIAKDLGELQKRYPEVLIGSYPYFRLPHFGVSLVLRSTSIKSLAEVKHALYNLIMWLGGTLYPEITE